MGDSNRNYYCLRQGVLCYHVCYMNICRNCKVNEGTIKECVNIYKGKKYEYYSCRDCCSSRAREYRKTKKGKESYKRAMRKQYQKNHTKVLARRQLNYHVKKGNIIVPSKCSKCKEEKKLEAHHSDYFFPLDVLWLCRQCHNKV